MHQIQEIKPQFRIPRTFGLVKVSSILTKDLEFKYNSRHTVMLNLLRESFVIYCVPPRLEGYSLQLRESFYQTA